MKVTVTTTPTESKVTLTVPHNADGVLDLRRADGKGSPLLHGALHQMAGDYAPKLEQGVQYKMQFSLGRPGVSPPPITQPAQTSHVDYLFAQVADAIAPGTINGYRKADPRFVQAVWLKAAGVTEEIVKDAIAAYGAKFIGCDHGEHGSLYARLGLADPAAIAAWSKVHDILATGIASILCYEQPIGRKPFGTSDPLYLDRWRKRNDIINAGLPKLDAVNAAGYWPWLDYGFTDEDWASNKGKIRDRFLAHIGDNCDELLRLANGRPAYLTYSIFFEPSLPLVPLPREAFKAGVELAIRRGVNVFLWSAFPKRLTAAELALIADRLGIVAGVKA